jgi:hypothetical protein
MPRNDQVTRQWFLLQAFERPGGATIEELAQSLPEDYACHIRTIRRDLQALEVRFPIYTDHVDGQIRWRLPRLQTVGLSRDPFIYEINWNESVRHVDLRANFDNLIRFKPGAGECLIQLNGLLRPLIHKKWAE